MYCACLVLLGLSLAEAYEIRGGGEIRVGEHLSQLVEKNLNQMDNNVTSLQYLLDHLKSINVELISGFRSKIKKTRVEKPIDRQATHEEKRTKHGPGPRLGYIFPGREYDSYPPNYPELNDFKMDDLSGDTGNKLRFIDFVTLVGPVYKMLISTINTDFKEVHGKDYPLRMMVHDFLQIAKHFNVGILSNGGQSHGVDWSGKDM